MPGAVKSLFTAYLRMVRREDSFSANAQVVSTFVLLFYIVLAETLHFNKNTLTFLKTERPQEVERHLLRAVEGYKF